MYMPLEIEKILNNYNIVPYAGRGYLSCEQYISRRTNIAGLEGGFVVKEDHIIKERNYLSIHLCLYLFTPDIICNNVFNLKNNEKCLRISYTPHYMYLFIVQHQYLQKLLSLTIWDYYNEDGMASFEDMCKFIVRTLHYGIGSKYGLV